MNGSVQTFTAPVDGIYQFELWGSGGAQGGGNGGYTVCSVHIGQLQTIYVFVGGTGVPLFGANSDLAVGGWNGGGGTTTCLAGAHSGSGGGMTHISYTNNPATSTIQQRGKNGLEGMDGTTGKKLIGHYYSFGGYWNSSGTIAVAGGGGGGGTGRTVAGNAHGGGTVTSGLRYYFNTGIPWELDENREYHTVAGSSQTSGYMKGVGQGSANSGGGGGGWWGGRSAGQTSQTAGWRCDLAGCGGTSYIANNGNMMNTQYNRLLNGVDGSIPMKPDSPLINGYTRVTLMQRY